MQTIAHRLTTAAATALLASSCLAQSVVQLKVPQAGSVTASGVVKGEGYVDYKFKIGAGQSATVTLTSKNKSVNFNFLPPSSDNVAMFNGSMNGNRMPARMVPVSGSYVVRVYQMGASPDGNKSNSFNVAVRIIGTVLKSLPASVDATLKGTPYHARSTAPCSIYFDKARKQCDVYVIRYGGGSASVEFRAGKLVRRVLFINGVPKAHDSQEAFTFKKAGDDTTLQFGDGPSEKYVVPDMVMFGG